MYKFNADDYVYISVAADVFVSGCNAYFSDNSPYEMILWSCT